MAILKIITLFWKEIITKVDINKDIHPKVLTDDHKNFYYFVSKISDHLRWGSFELENASVFPTGRTGPLLRS